VVRNKKTRCWHKAVPEKSSWADTWCTRLQIALRVFSFRLKLWVCKDLVAGQIPVFLHIRNELSQGKDTTSEIRMHKYLRLARFSNPIMGLVPGPGSG